MPNSRHNPAPTLTIPTIHYNGSGRARLLEQIRAAHDAADLLAKSLQEMAPHGRDYYPQGDTAFASARVEHQIRTTKVKSILDELEALGLAVIDAPGPK